jgi:hypothetical protein
MEWIKCLVLAGGAALALGAAPANAATLCVGPGPGCHQAIQPAVDAAHEGDTITIAPGTYAGGIAIDKSVNLVGAGAARTVIKGGSPVLLIGAPFPWSTTRATVSISKVTITGGDNSSFPGTAVAQGGGINITPTRNPAGGAGATGATVTIGDSVVTGNRVYAVDQIPPGFCGPRACAFADGAGIDNNGTLTVTNTRISDNEAVSPPGVATSTGSGGISNHPVGTLVVRRSAITGNRASSNSPNGREAQAGGIGGNGTITVEDSVVSGNSVELSAASLVTDAAFAGGILVGEDGNGTITNTIVRDNHALATGVDADIGAFGGGIVSFGPLTLQRSAVDHNTVTVSTTGGGAFADGGGLEVDDEATITDTLIAFNTVTSTSEGHSAVAQGGGLANAGRTTLRRTLVVGNSVTANGGDGVAQGGGVWNGIFEGPQPSLTLLDSAIVRNRASGSPGVTVHGGGLYTDFPVTVLGTLIAGNGPDQCFGC